MKIEPIRRYPVRPHRERRARANARRFMLLADPDCF